MKKAFISTASILLAVTGILATAPAANAAIPTGNLDQASLGDSFTRGAAIGGKNSSGSPINNPSANWSTGTDTRVPSNLQQLAALKNVTVTGHNYSVGGTKAGDIPRQANLVESNVDYTTILSGGNDICGATSLTNLPTVSGYKANIEQGISILLQKNPNMVIGLGSVPSLKTLYEVGKTNPTSNLYHTSNRICPIALGTFSTETAAQAESRRTTVDARVKDFNNVLKQIADSNPNVFFDNNAIYSTEYTIDDLSTADYFHPSYSGQSKVALSTFAAFKNQGAFGGSVVTPPAVVKPTTQLVSATTVSGSIKLAATATSDTAIQKVSVYVPALKQTLTLTKNSDGVYRSATITTTSYPNGTYPATLTAVDADGDSTSVDYKITIKN